MRKMPRAARSRGRVLRCGPGCHCSEDQRRVAHQRPHYVAAGRDRLQRPAEPPPFPVPVAGRRARRSSDPGAGYNTRPRKASQSAPGTPSRCSRQGAVPPFSFDGTICLNGAAPEGAERCQVRRAAQSSPSRRLNGATRERSGATGSRKTSGLTYDNTAAYEHLPDTRPDLLPLSARKVYHHNAEQQARLIRRAHPR